MNETHSDRIFSILDSFLLHHREEVEGRAATMIPNEYQEMLTQFSRGQLPKARVQDLMTVLARDRALLELLAAEVRSRSRSAAAESPDKP